MASAITLTDEFIKSVKPTAGKQTEYPDAKVAGLALRVSHQGTKSWTFRFRNADGRQRRLSLGTYPATVLAKARRKALDALAEAQDGNDPVTAKREEKAKVGLRTIRTISDLSADYFSAAKIGRHRPHGRPKRTSTLSLEQNYFDRLIEPKFGRLAVGDLIRADFQRFLDNLMRTSPSAARQCRNVLRQMYNFAIRREITNSNPAQFGEVPSSKSRDRVLTDAEMKAVWSACEAPETVEGLLLSQGVALAIQLAMVTLQRGNEVCGASEAEIDMISRTWIIPGERTKNHRAHVVPLPVLAINLIEAAIALQDAAGPIGPRYLFPSPKDGRPVTRRALTRAMKRIGDALGIKDATPHDFRRTGSTHMTSERLGIPRFHVSCVLNHISDTGGAAAVTSVYDRNAYLPEKRRALDKWATRLLEIVGQEQQSDNVVRLR